jgi:hypothetical protein
MFLKGKANYIWAFPSYNHIAHPVFPFWWFASTTQMYSWLCVPNLKLSHSFSYLQVFHVCQLKICLWSFIPWVDHEILDLLKDPSFYSCSLSPSVQLSKNHKGRNWSFMITWINLFKKEEHCDFVKIAEDHCNPFPLFLPRNLGVEILVRWVEL